MYLNVLVPMFIHILEALLEDWVVKRGTTNSPCLLTYFLFARATYCTLYMSVAIMLMCQSFLIPPSATVNGKDEACASQVGANIACNTVL